MARYLAFAGIVVVACGGAPTPAPTQVSNSATSVQPVTRDEVITRAMAAMTAGDVDGLMSLADLDGLFDRALSCADDQPGDSKRKFASRLRDGFADSIKGIRDAKIELTSIENEVDVGGAVWGHGTTDRPHNADFLAKDGRVSSKCTARTDLTVHEARIRVRKTQGGKQRDRELSVYLIAEAGRWHLVRMPGKLDADNITDVMEDFSQRMCACKDKACADRIQDEFTKWATEISKKMSNQRPDPEVVKRTTDIMSRYTECMTKLFMNAANNNSGPTP